MYQEKAYSVSIGDMMANVNAANILTISNTSTNSYTASPRIFKFDPEVRAQFNIDVDTTLVQIQAVIQVL